MPLPSPLALKAAADCYHIVHAGDLGATKLIPEMAVYVQAAIDEALSNERIVNSGSRRNENGQPNPRQWKE